MDQFQTTAKLWPSGAPLDLGTDSNTFTAPTVFNRYAPNFVTSMDGMHNYQFLFWNTGRHLTNKRRVQWTFSVGSWSQPWTATRWYGTPPGGGNGGPPRVRADAFTLGGNAPLGTETPINGTASTYAAGAWPFMGDDHAIDTSTGAVTVVARDPFASLQFAGWLQLVWGGDNSDTFYESDAGAAPGTPSFYDTFSGPFAVGMGASADLLATYGNQEPRGLDFDFGPVWEEFFPGEQAPKLDIPGFVDPPPEDILRLKILQRMLQQTRPGLSGGTDFQLLIESAPRMSLEELNRAIQSVQVSLDLGKTALSTLEAQLKRGGK